MRRTGKVILDRRQGKRKKGAKRVELILSVGETSGEANHHNLATGTGGGGW